MPRLRFLAPAFVAAGLAFPAVAHADIESDIVSTTCSSDQIIAALQQASPVAYGILTSDPQRKATTQSQLDAFLSQAPATRKSQLHKPNPDGGPSIINTLIQYGPTTEQVLNTCSQF